MVIFLGKDLDEVFRDICSDLDRRAFDKSPVIGKYLISDPDDPVGFLDRISVIQIELLPQIKEKDVRISLYIFVGLSNYNALSIVFKRKKVGIALPGSDLLFFLNERRIRIHREILVKFRNGDAVILVEKQ